MIKMLNWGGACLIALSLFACTGQESATTTEISAGKSRASITVQTSDFKPVVQLLYVGYFGRPADVGGLAYFANQFLQAGAPTTVVELATSYQRNANVRALVDSLGTSAESSALYPGDNRVFITSIYNNLFGRAPDAAGLDYWANAIDRKQLTRANGVLSIMAGAQGADITIIENKRTVAVAFTEAVSAPDLAGSYSGLDVNVIARDMLSKVSVATNLASFQPTILSAVAELAKAPRRGTVFPAIEGLFYQTGSASGYLEKTGEYTYAPGQQVTFSIGAVELASVPTGNTVTPFDSDNEATSLNLARVIVALNKGTTTLSVPPLPNTTLASARLDDDMGAAAALAIIDPHAVLPAANSSNVTGLVNATRQQVAAMAGTTGGVYTFFDSSLGDGYNSFLGNGAPAACSAAIPRVSSASVSLFSQDWTTGSIAGSAKLNYSDETSSAFTITGKTGTFQRNGTTYDYALDSPKNAQNRIVVIKITNALLAGGTYKCNVENVFMRDAGRTNLPPTASFFIQQSSAGTAASYAFSTQLNNIIGTKLRPAGTSFDVDGRIVSLIWHSTKGDRTVTQTTTRYGGTESGFAETVPRGEKVTVTLTAIDDQGAKSTKSFVINPNALSLGEIVSLLDGKLYQLIEGSYVAYYRVNAAAGTITEWEPVGTTVCTANSFSIRDVTSGIDLSKIAFLGSSFTYVESGQTSEFVQAANLPSQCTSTAVKPPPITPPPATPPVVPPVLLPPSTCPFTNGAHECVREPLGYLGIAPANGDRYAKTDICNTYQVLGFPVKTSTCVEASGSGGYLIIRNDGPPADVCWTVHYNAAKPSLRACYLGMPSGAITRPGCSACEAKNGGVRAVELVKYRVE